MRTLHYHKDGFTILELLLAFGLLLIIAGFAVFPLIGYKNTEEFSTQEKIIVAFLRDAQQRAITREENFFWGVRFTNNAPGTTDTFKLFFGKGLTSQLTCGSDTPQAVTIVETRALKSSSDFDIGSLAVGCSKDIVFNPGIGTPNYTSPYTPPLINSITIIPQGFSIPPKTITVEDNGKITS